jgi:hypothetical protein
MGEIINPFEREQFIYLGLPGLTPSTVAGWFMGVAEADRPSVIGFAPIFLDQTTIQKYFQNIIPIKIQRTPQSPQDQIEAIQKQQKILKGESPNGNQSTS